MQLLSLSIDRHQKAIKNQALQIDRFQIEFETFFIIWLVSLPRLDFFFKGKIKINSIYGLIIWMTKKLQLYFNFTENQEMFLMICFTHIRPFIQESQTAFQIIN